MIIVVVVVVAVVVVVIVVFVIAVVVIIIICSVQWRSYDLRSDLRGRSTLDPRKKAIFVILLWYY